MHCVIQPLGQYWQVSSQWPHCNVEGTITTQQGNALDVTSTGYNENSVRFSFLVNFGWLFSIHTNEQRCISLQTYVNTPRLNELLYIFNDKERAFRNITFDVVESEEWILLYGSQYLPSRVHIRCENKEVQCSFKFEIDGHIESDKNANLLWQGFFICFCRGEIIGRVINKSDGSVLDEFTGLLGGEYAHHSLYPCPVTVWTEDGKMDPPSANESIPFSILYVFLVYLQLWSTETS